MVAAEQPCFVCDGIHLQQVVFQKIVKPCIIRLFLLWQDAELVAVVEIQFTQAADFLCVFQRATDTVHSDLRLLFGKTLEFDRIGIFLNAFHNPLVGIILAELIEPLRSLPSLSDNRPVFAVGVKAHSVSWSYTKKVDTIMRIHYNKVNTKRRTKHDNFHSKQI